MVFAKLKVISDSSIILLFTMTPLLITPVAQWSRLAFACERSRDQIPLWQIFFFPLLYGVPKFAGSNPSKKSQIFNTFQHTCHAPQGAFMAILNNPRGVGSGGKRRKLA